MARGNREYLPGTVVRHLGRGIVKKKRERWCTGWLVSRGRGSKRKERRARRKVRMAGPTSAECNNLEHLPSDSRVLSHPGEQGGRIRRSVSSYLRAIQPSFTRIRYALDHYFARSQERVHTLKRSFFLRSFFFFNIFRMDLDLDWYIILFLYFVFAINNNNDKINITWSLRELFLYFLRINLIDATLLHDIAIQYCVW